MSEGGVTDGGVLHADVTLEYPFTRSTGPVVGAFLTALREGFVVGIKRADGTVLVPPCEYDPETAAPLTEIVEVGDAGVVTSWCWNGEPRPGQPFDDAYAWAMIRLDGADTSLLHAVHVPESHAIRTGMRVKAVWRAEREGHITDIECFVPEAT